MSYEDMIFARESDMPEEDGIVEIPTSKFLIFESDGLKFGALVKYVVEIITNHTVTHLPVVPDYVSGIINLRGQIIPIMDIRVRLGKPCREDCAIIVLDVDGTQFGITVDAVDQMVDIPDTDVLPMPERNTQKLLSGMCTLPGGGTMLVLDCVLLLEA